MRQFIGIDLGTTNSAICSYDGQNVRVWKSPDQNDVTPSAIYIDKRGNRYYGQRAYEMHPGIRTTVQLFSSALWGQALRLRSRVQGITMTPKECSAEILKVLFGYLPEDIRNAETLPLLLLCPLRLTR